MSLEKLPGYREAIQAVERNLTPRAMRLAGLERFADGTQYEGLPDWFSDEKPLWERAPCIVDPIVRSAIDSNCDLLLGEGRFPMVTVEEVEGDDADAFEHAISAIVSQSRLKPAAREVFAAGQASTSACAVFGVRSGRLFIDAVKARWCEAELDAEGAIKRLVIQYPYLTIEKIAGDHIVVARLFRRVIDDKRDVTYKPGEARADGVEPQWVEDPTKTVAHGLGFCPAVWYPHMRGCAIAGDIDGVAIHERLTDEIRAHDFALSQRHRAALYAGDPQWTEIGVEAGFNPSGKGRRAEVPATLTGGRPSETNPIHASYVSAQGRGGARKKSPGVVWQYPGKPTDIKVELHALPGDALKALDDHARDLRIKIAEALGVVFLDPESLPAASTLSGRALEALRARQLDRCDNYRADIGDRFILPALGMLIRIAIAKRLKIKGLDVVQKVITSAGDMWSWHYPPFGLAWGRYFRLDSEEEAKQVELVAKARDAGLATLRASVEKLRSVFDVKDIDAYIDELAEEQADAMRRQQEMAADMMLGGGDHDDGQDDDAGSGDGPPRGSRPGKAREADG